MRDLADSRENPIVELVAESDQGREAVIGLVESGDRHDEQGEGCPIQQVDGTLQNPNGGHRQQRCESCDRCLARLLKGRIVQKRGAEQKRFRGQQDLVRRHPARGEGQAEKRQHHRPDDPMSDAHGLASRRTIKPCRQHQQDDERDHGRYWRH